VKVRKAVIPAAGLGTRFLPASKAQPKEMLPVVDKPAIQYVLEEAVRAGLEDILIVTGRGKGAIEDHFDRAWELEGLLAEKGDTEKLEEVKAIAKMADVHYIRQKMPLGLGHAISVAEQHVGNHPFAVLLGDDLIGEDEKLLADLIDRYERHQATVITGMEVEHSRIGSYGAITPEESPVEPDLYRVLDIVEKPDPAEAPSNLATIGRYVLDPEVFEALRETKPDRKGEIQLTDAIKRLTEGDAKGVLALRFTGVRYDIGDKVDFLRATVELAARRQDVGPPFLSFLRRFVAQLEQPARELGR
jgi:UTP--glucose-1-phosphate uridylyltransferase